MIDYPDREGEFPEQASLNSIDEKLAGILEATTRSETPAPTIIRLELPSGVAFTPVDERWRSSLRLRVDRIILSRFGGGAAEPRQIVVGTASVFDYDTAGATASTSPIEIRLPFIIEEGQECFLRTAGGGNATQTNVVYIVAYPERTPKAMN